MSFWICLKVNNSKLMSLMILIYRWYKPWFYKHVEKFLTEGEAEEYIPLRDGSLNNIGIFGQIQS